MTDLCSICGTPLESVWENSKGEFVCEDCFLEEKGEELNARLDKEKLKNLVPNK